MSDPTEGQAEAPTHGQASSIDPVQRQRRLSKKERQAREDREFFRVTAESEAGRRFLWSILAECHAFEHRWANSPVGFPDVHATMFEAGKQDVGQRLYQTWHLKAPLPVMQMLKEHHPAFKEFEA